jgi:TatD DNase family protein
MTAGDGPPPSPESPALRWIDSHCHLQPPWHEGDVGAALDRARGAGVVAMVCVGTDLATSRVAVELAASEPDIWAAVGLHPHDASRFDAERAELADLARAPRVVAVGETGFDLHYTHSVPEAQEASFRWHVQLAHERDLALVIHTREAWDATFRVLAEEGVPARTVFHCFTGGPDEAARAVACGGHLSFSGIVSFRNAQDVRDAAAATPRDRVLVETDAPFLAPVPHRGRPNEPALLPDVGRALAAAAGLPLAELADLTRANAARVFGLPG